MFVKSIAALFLAGFISPVSGQNTTSLASATVTATPSTTPHQTSSASTSNKTVQTSQTTAIASSAQTPNSEPPANTTTPMVPPTSSISSISTSASITPPAKQTCAKLSVVIDKSWNDNYKNRTSENFRNLSDSFSSVLTSLYNEPKYTNVSEVQFKEENGKVFASAKLCLVFKGGDEVFIEDVFKNKVKTGKLDTDLPVIKDSDEFEPLGVSFKDWKAKEGECEEKCEGAAGPFFIVRECKPKTGFSCKGHKTTKETKECATYCSSTVAVSVSSIILVIGIFLSSSFQ